MTAKPEGETDRQELSKARSMAGGGPAGRMATMGMPVERSADFGASTRRMLRRLLPGRMIGVALVMLALGAMVTSVVGPRILGRATDIVFDGIRSPEGIDRDDLTLVLALAFGLYVVSAVLTWVQAILVTGLVQRTMRQLRADVEDKLHRLPLRHVDRLPRGDLLSRVTNDIDNVSQSLQQTLSMMLTSALSLIGVVIMMFAISWELALITVVTIPLTILTMRLITARSRSRFVAQWRHTGALNAHVEETFTGHSLVKAYGRSDEVERRFDVENEQLHTAGFWAQFISGTIQPAMLFVGNVNYVAVAVVGGLRVASGRLSLGDVQAFIQYTRQFSMPLTQMASLVNVLQSGIASAERVFELLDAPEESADDVDAEPFDEVVGRVEFDRVSFSYDPEKPLIADLSFVAEPGRTVAIVGPTGAGKTTLVNLIMRFYELDGGRILLDGRDIATLPRHVLRSRMGMVLQDTWLFGGTIRENIAYGNTEATDADILEAAKAAYVDRFVRALPDGYDTVVDDEGSNLSAGERQLVTIARAFLADPTILILDEATSSVDTRTEVLIQRAMARLRSTRTSFVIAHRLSTIRDADTILVMDGGRIVEQGSHDELLRRGEAYFALHHAQFTGAAVELDVA